MPIIQTASGEWVNVPDDVVPERLEQIRSGTTSGGGTRTSRPAGQPRKQLSEAEQRANADEKLRPRSMIRDFTRSAFRGATFNFADEISGATSAAANSLGNLVGLGNGKSFGDEYRTARDTQRILDHRAEQNSPIASTVGELAGGLIIPGGTIAKGVKGLEAARGIGSVAKALGKAGPTRVAILAGAGQGALNAAGSADEARDVPSAALTGGLAGGAVGGVLGAGLKVGTGLAHRWIVDNGQKSARRVAVTKLADRMENSKAFKRHGQDEIVTHDANGGDMALMDRNPALRADAMVLARKGDLEGSELIRDTAQARTDTRIPRVMGQLERRAGMSPEAADSDDLINTIIAKRRKEGKEDWKVGGVFDAPVKWSDELDDFWAEAPDDTLAAMRAARREIEGRRGDPDDWIREVVDENGKSTYTIIPTMRTFDYLRKGFQSEIGIARKAGDEAKVQRLQSELSEFKTLFNDANEGDDIAQALTRQRTQYERQGAVEQGQKDLNRIVNGRQGAREVLKEYAKLKPHEVEERRVGLLDSLFDLDHTPNPIGKFNAMMRNERQREALAFAFKGRNNLDAFAAFLKTEGKSALTDNKINGAQAITGDLALASNSLEKDTNGVFGEALRGWISTGRLGGFAAGAVRGINRLGMSKEAQEEYAKLLAGKGEGLADELANVRDFTTRRARRAKRRSVGVARAAQQPFTDEIRE